tara:strand:+ start:157 stop:423 length:267 start_codon:yes stop_codon:yes gene_type:complete
MKESTQNIYRKDSFMTQLTTQTQQVLKTLIEQKTITSWEAIQKFRCTRLSAVIYNLRQDGYDIRTHRMTNEKTGKSFAEYNYVGKIDD